MRMPATLLVLGGSVLALAGCGGRAAEAPLLVGHVADLSGPDREQGEQAARGIRLAVKEAHAQGGRPIVVLHTDTGGKLDAFEAQAVRLAAVNNVPALMGGSTPTEVERLDRARTVVVGLAGQHTRAMSDRVFLTGLTPAARGWALARGHLANAPAAAVFALGAALHAGLLGPALTLAPAEASLRVVILVDERHQENLQVVEAFTREFSAAGRPAPLLWRYAGDADFTALARRIEAAQPAAVLLAGDVPALGRLRGLLPQLPLFFGGAANQEVLQRHPETRSEVYLVTNFVADTDASRAHSFMKEYRAAFHEAPGPSAALAYESAQLLIAAARQTDNPNNRKDLAEHLQALQDFPGLCGSVGFDDHVLRRPLFVVRLDGSRSVTVARFEGVPPAQPLPARVSAEKKP
jgi:ABC-type branched-subunit amino acid transport system substrate-binding protein